MFASRANSSNSWVHCVISTAYTAAPCWLTNRQQMPNFEVMYFPLVVFVSRNIFVYYKQGGEKKIKRKLEGYATSANIWSEVKMEDKRTFLKKQKGRGELFKSRKVRTFDLNKPSID